MFNSSMMVPSVADIAAVTDSNRNSGWGMDGGWWAIIILFALFGGWGRGFSGGGFSGGNGCGCDGSCATVGDVQRGFDNQGVTNKLNGLENGICGLGYDQLAQMNGINQNITNMGFGIQNAIQQASVASMQDTNAISRQLADCCCENRAAIAQVRYDMATNNCAVTTAIATAARDITDNQNANYRALHDEIVANRMEDKNAQIAELRSQVWALNLAQSQANQNNYLVNTLRPCPTPAYITCNPWAGQAAYGSCGTFGGFNGCGCGCN